MSVILRGVLPEVSWEQRGSEAFQKMRWYHRVRRDDAVDGAFLIGNPTTQAIKSLNLIT
jgi:hypothetical protein